MDDLGVAPIFNLLDEECERFEKFDCAPRRPHVETRLCDNGKNKGTTGEDVSYHASSVRIDTRHNASFFGEWVRGEWSVEKYHARRDGTYCEDIRTRRCDENVTGALILARTMALYYFSKSGMENCQAFKEEMQRNPDKVFDLVMGNDA